jgi:GTP cyclohydrolase I
MILYHFIDDLCEYFRSPFKMNIFVAYLCPLEIWGLSRRVIL